MTINTNKCYNSKASMLNEILKVNIKRKFKEFVFFISLNSISIAFIIIYILQVTLHSAIANHEPFVSVTYRAYTHKICKTI